MSNVNADIKHSVLPQDFDSLNKIKHMSITGNPIHDTWAVYSPWKWLIATQRSGSFLPGHNTPSVTSNELRYSYITTALPDLGITSAPDQIRHTFDFAMVANPDVTRKPYWDASQLLTRFQQTHMHHHGKRNRSLEMLPNVIQQPSPLKPGRQKRLIRSPQSTWPRLLFPASEGAVLRFHLLQTKIPFPKSESISQKRKVDSTDYLQPGPPRKRLAKGLARGIAHSSTKQQDDDNNNNHDDDNKDLHSHDNDDHGESKEERKNARPSPATVENVPLSCPFTANVCGNGMYILISPDGHIKEQVEVTSKTAKAEFRNGLEPGDLLLLTTNSIFNQLMPAVIAYAILQFRKELKSCIGLHHINETITHDLVTFLFRLYNFLMSADNSSKKKEQKQQHQQFGDHKESKDGDDNDVDDDSYASADIKTAETVSLYSSPVPYMLIVEAPSYQNATATEAIESTSNLWERLLELNSPESEISDDHKHLKPKIDSFLDHYIKIYSKNEFRDCLHVQPGEWRYFHSDFLQRFHSVAETQAQAQPQPQPQAQPQEHSTANDKSNTCGSTEHKRSLSSSFYIPDFPLSSFQLAWFQLQPLLNLKELNDLKCKSMPKNILNQKMVDFLSLRMLPKYLCGTLFRQTFDCAQFRSTTVKANIESIQGSYALNVDMYNDYRTALHYSKEITHTFTEIRSCVAFASTAKIVTLPSDGRKRVTAAERRGKSSTVKATLSIYQRFHHLQTQILRLHSPIAEEDANLTVLHFLSKEKISLILVVRYPSQLQRFHQMISELEVSACSLFSNLFAHHVDSQFSLQQLKHYFHRHGFSNYVLFIERFNQTYCSIASGLCILEQPLRWNLCHLNQGRRVRIGCKNASSFCHLLPARLENTVEELEKRQLFQDSAHSMYIVQFNMPFRPKFDSSSSFKITAPDAADDTRQSSIARGNDTSVTSGNGISDTSIYGSEITSASGFPELKQGDSLFDDSVQLSILDVKSEKDVWWCLDKHTAEDQTLDVACKFWFNDFFNIDIHQWSLWLQRHLKSYSACCSAVAAFTPEETVAAGLHHYQEQLLKKIDHVS